jgi:hypothetical protein
MAIDSVKERHIRRAVNVVEFPLSRCVREGQAVPARAPELSDEVCEDLESKKRRVLDIFAALRAEEAGEVGPVAPIDARTLAKLRALRVTPKRRGAPEASTI